MKSHLDWCNTLCRREYAQSHALSPKDERWNQGLLCPAILYTQPCHNTEALGLNEDLPLGALLTAYFLAEASYALRNHWPSQPCSITASTTFALCCSASAAPRLRPAAELNKVMGSIDKEPSDKHRFRHWPRKDRWSGRIPLVPLKSSSD